MDYPTSSTHLSEIISEDKVIKDEFVVSDTRYSDQPSRRLMIVKNNFKYIFDKKTGTEELYDIDVDPKENVNLLIDRWKDVDRKTFYKLDEIYFYSNWDNAKLAYEQLSEYKNKIWVKGSYVRGKAISAKKIFNRVGILNYLKWSIFNRNNSKQKGRWQSKVKQ